MAGVFRFPNFFRRHIFDTRRKPALISGKIRNAGAAVAGKYICRFFGNYFSEEPCKTKKREKKK
jgi:hypothetical protein